MHALLAIITIFAFQGDDIPEETLPGPFSQSKQAVPTRLDRQSHP